MAKIILYSIFWLVFIFLLASLRCMTFNPLLWGWGTITAFTLLGAIGTLVFIGYANEDIRNFSRWTVLVAAMMGVLFVFFEIVYPGLKQPTNEPNYIKVPQ